MTHVTGSAEKVVAHVDGFNLYFGIRQHGRRHLWLDLEALVRSLLKPHQQLVAVRYFTAPVRDDPAAERRQLLYWKALEEHCKVLEIRKGRFQQKTRRCFSCSSSWVDYEEKESDVSLASSLIEDGVRGLFRTALLVSADSDMAPAVRTLKRLAPQVKVVATFPPNRKSGQLASACDAVFPISMTKVRQAQLPETVLAAGIPVSRPDHWK